MAPVITGPYPASIKRATRSPSLYIDFGRSQCGHNGRDRPIPPWSELRLKTVRKHESSRPPSGGARTVAGAASFAGEPVSARSGLPRVQAQQEKEQGEGEAP